MQPYKALKRVKAPPRKTQGLRKDGQFVISDTPSVPREEMPSKPAAEFHAFRSTRCDSVQAEHLGVPRAAMSIRKQINVLFCAQIFEIR